MDAQDDLTQHIWSGFMNAMHVKERPIPEEWTYLDGAFDGIAYVVERIFKEL